MNKEDIDKQIQIIDRSYKFFKNELKKNKEDLNLLVGEVFSLKDLASLFTLKLENNDFEYLDNTSFFSENVDEVILVNKIKSLKLDVTLKFENLTKLYPDFSLSYYHLGFIYVNEGKYQKAKLYFNEFLVKSNSDKDFNSGENAAEMIEEVVNLSEELDAHVKVENAISFLENSIHNYDVYKNTNSISELKKIDDMKKVLISFKDDERYQNYWLLKYHLSQVYYYEKEFKKAIKLLEEGLKVKPLSIDMLNLICKIYKELNDDINLNKYLDKLKLATKEYEENF